jgi:PAS domain S-box-containing protein
MAEADKQVSIIGELRQLRSLVEETETSLSSQRDILKMRGMNLPPMAMKSIGNLSSDLAQLETNVISEQTELAQLRSLADTGSMINSTLDLDGVFEQAMDVVISLTDAERGYIILKDPETGDVDFRVVRENELMPKQATSEPQVSQTILNEVLESGEPLLADNAYKDDRLQSGQSIAALSLRSVLCVPLNYKGEVVGVVYVDNRLRTGVFEEREKNLLAAFANQAAIAIENARLYESVQSALAEISAIKDLMDNVFESIGSGIITTDVVHQIQTLNRAASAILECDRDASLGKKIKEILPSVSATLDSHLNAVTEQDESQILEAEMNVEKRGRIAVAMKISPLKNAEQTTQGVAMVLDDVTNQRESEEILSSLKRYLPPQMVDQIHEIAKLDLGGERREVTGMFVESIPITSFPSTYRPQQVMEEINVYLSKATDAIHERIGIIDKYMGHEIMVLYNTQLNPMDDHALRAVLTAVSIRDVFIELYKELGINPDPHYYRIGIHTGVATLGNVGSVNRREFSAIGDTINLCKRLEENAVSGQIIISEETRLSIEAVSNGESLPVRFEEREPMQVKGRQQKAQVYEVFRA